MLHKFIELLSLCIKSFFSSKLLTVLISVLCQTYGTSTAIVRLLLALCLIILGRQHHKCLGVRVVELQIYPRIQIAPNVLNGLGTRHRLKMI